MRMVDTAFIRLFRPIRDSFLKKFWNGKWPDTNIYYNARGKTIMITDILNESDEALKPLKDLVVARRWDKVSDPDWKIKQIWRWVNDNIQYKGDFGVWKRTEYWQYASETFDLRTGDCEDGTILLYQLARLAGIPEFRMRICAGNVTDPSNSSRVVGHAYLIYLHEGKNLWYTVDWTYYFRENWNDFAIVPHGYRKEKYQGIWWAFNGKNQWALHNMLFVAYGKLIRI